MNKVRKPMALLPLTDHPVTRSEQLTSPVDQHVWFLRGIFVGFFVVVVFCLFFSFTFRYILFFCLLLSGTKFS